MSTEVLCVKPLVRLWKFLHIDSRLESERLPTVILKFICEGDKKLAVIEIVNDNGTFSGDFRMLSNIWHGTFGKNSYWALAVKYFFKNTQLRSFTRYWRYLWFYKCLMLVPINPCKHRLFFFINIRNISLLNLFVIVFTPNCFGKNIRNLKFHYHNQNEKR